MGKTPSSYGSILQEIGGVVKRGEGFAPIPFQGAVAILAFAVSDEAAQYTTEITDFIKQENAVPYTGGWEILSIQGKPYLLIGKVREDLEYLKVEISNNTGSQDVIGYVSKRSIAVHSREELQEDLQSKAEE